MGKFTKSNYKANLGEVWGEKVGVGVLGGILCFFGAVFTLETITWHRKGLDLAV